MKKEDKTKEVETLKKQWELSNGQTLCKDCHNKTKKGYKNLCQNLLQKI